LTPHVIQSGASDLIPIDSRRSDDEPIVDASGCAGAASIFTATGFGASAFTAAGAATAAGAFGVSALAIGAYSPPLSRAAARSDAV
jgi:hypothetical protein